MHKKEMKINPEQMFRTVYDDSEICGQKEEEARMHLLLADHLFT